MPESRARLLAATVQRSIGGPNAHWEVVRNDALAALAELVALAERAETLETALRDCEQAGFKITATLIACSSWLSTPYDDAPKWTPWTRFVERDLQRLDEARKAARAALSAAQEEKP